MFRSLQRSLKCRQIGQIQMNISIDGTSFAPSASGPDAAFIESITDNGVGSYTINLNEIVKLAPFVSGMVAITPFASLAVIASTTSSITVGAFSAQGVQALLAVQDITYTARAYGDIGELITIEYTDTETAGAEVVTVTDTAIVVGIESGVSTATQVQAAIAASAEAQHLISSTISGTAGTAQVTAAAAPLAGGVEATAIDADFNIQFQVSDQLSYYL